MNRQQHINEMDRKRVDIARDVERLSRDASGIGAKVKDDAKGAAKRAVSDVKGGVKAMVTDAKNVATSAGSDAGHMAKEKAKQTVRAMDPRKVAREQPWVALGAGVVAGFLFTWFVLPKRTRYAGVVVDEDFPVPPPI